MGEKGTMIKGATRGDVYASRDADERDDEGRKRVIQLITPVGRKLRNFDYVRGRTTRISSADSRNLATFFNGNFEWKIEAADGDTLVVLPDFSNGEGFADITPIVRIPVWDNYNDSETNYANEDDAISFSKTYTGANDPSPTYDINPGNKLTLGDYFENGSYTKWLGAIKLDHFDTDWGALAEVVTLLLKEKAIVSGTNGPDKMKICIADSEFEKSYNGYSPWYIGLNSEIQFEKLYEYLSLNEGAEVNFGGHTFSVDGDFPTPDLTEQLTAALACLDFDNNTDPIYLIFGNTDLEYSGGIATYDIEATDAELYHEYSQYRILTNMALETKRAYFPEKSLISSGKLGTAYYGEPMTWDLIGGGRVYLHLSQVETGGISLMGGVV